MWSYYGSKTNVIDLYPKPMYNKIIEPFAGTARYALKYWDRDILMVDKYEVLINIWKWLQKCSAADIKGLPHFIKPGQVLDDIATIKLSTIIFKSNCGSQPKHRPTAIIK